MRVAMQQNITSRGARKIERKTAVKKGIEGENNSDLLSSPSHFPRAERVGSAE